MLNLTTHTGNLNVVSTRCGTTAGGRRAGSGAGFLDSEVGKPSVAASRKVFSFDNGWS